MAFLSIRN